MSAPGGVLCGRCAAQNAPGALTCAQCATPLRRSVPRPPEAVEEPDDEATRALCAAVHRDEGLAADIVRAYLVEEVGSVPPSPGLDAAAVLGDAVAAAVRQRLRDGLALVLLVALAVVAPVALAVWVVAAVLVVWRVGSGKRDRVRLVATPVALVWLVVLVAVAALADVGPVGGGGWPCAAVLAAVAVLLGADRYAGMRFLRRRFQPDRFTADRRQAGSSAERALRGLGGRGAFAAQLDRVARADERHPDGAGTVDVIVHRTETPFVGGGFQLRGQPVVVLPKAGRTPDPFDPADLHTHLAERLVRSGEAVAPGGLLHRYQVVISARRLVTLVRGRRTPFADTLFPRLDRPPLRRIPRDEVGPVVREEVDGARFYSCFRSESWDRNLVVSCYLHVGVSHGTITLSLTPCVLPPVDRWFEQVDEATRFGHGWPNAAAADVLALPATAWSRLRALARPLRPQLRHRARRVEPERYGADRSLREGASSVRREGQWYQADDAALRAAAISGRLFDEIASYLKKRGYDVSALRRNADGVIQTNTINITGGKFVETNIANGSINQTVNQKDEEAQGA